MVFAQRSMQYQTMRATGKAHYKRLWHHRRCYGILFTTNRKRACHKACYDGSL